MNVIVYIVSANMDASVAALRRRNKTTSYEGRNRVIAAYENGTSGKYITTMLDMNRGTVCNKQGCWQHWHMTVLAAWGMIQQTCLGTREQQTYP